MSRTEALTTEEHAEPGQKQREICFVLWASGRKGSIEEQEVLGGSVSMATSQLGKRCKSKREGDIKGLNDTQRRGGQKEMVDEDKEERRGAGGGGGGNRSDVHFILPVDSLRITEVEAAILRFKRAQH